MKIDYSKYTKEQLKSKIVELMESIMKTYSFTEATKYEKPEYRKKYRKEIARIKTELNRRRNKNE